MKHKLTDLDSKNKVMPEDKSGVTVLLDKEGNQYVSPSEHFKWGFNKSNALHRELVLECDVEKIKKIILKSDMYTFNEGINKSDIDELAKSIINSMPSWAWVNKICPADKERK